MEIKKLANNTLNFVINRTIEIFGITILVIGILLLISLLSFSPDDPNFIFPDNTVIKNLLGFRGSFTADIFFQSFGLIALLIPFSLILTGMEIIFNKKIFLIIKSFFYTTIYSLFGSLFFSFFYPNAFKLYINGNGGFLGKYLETTFLNSIININPQTSYFILIIIISSFFLISVQFKINYFYNLLKKMFNFVFSKKQKNYTNKNEIINEFIPQDKIKNLIQEDLPFVKNDSNENNKKIKFIQPSINLLKVSLNFSFQKIKKIIRIRMK